MMDVVYLIFIKEMLEKALEVDE